jgi:hypothetical protein
LDFHNGIKLKTALDWTDKVSRIEEFDFTEIINNYASKSLLSYLQDTDDPELSQYFLESKKWLGDGIIEIDNEHIQGETVIYEAPFASCINVNSYNNQINIPQIFTKGDPRILLVTTDTVSNLTFGAQTEFEVIGTSSSDVATTIPFAWFVKADYTTAIDEITESLAFDAPLFPTVGESIIDTYLNDYVLMLNSFNLLKADLFLNSVDISSLDFTVPIFINETYHYLNKVDGYEGAGVTNVELIKIG